VLRIFISHKSDDSREAVALKQWLAEQRPGLADEIFLDIDPNTGLELGWEWKEQLVLRTSVCQWLICLVSRSWIASRECLMEYHFAERSGKRIVIARLEELSDADWREAGHDTGDFTSHWQHCDLFAAGDQTCIEVEPRPPVVCAGPPVGFNTAALYQIRRAVEGAGIRPENFRWPPADDPKRAPYRGWEPFEDIDAGVFFGRDAAVASGLAVLRGMRFPSPERSSGPESMFVVLGPSGSGKSSFLRAGLVPRLQRDDRNFMVLGVMRAGHGLTGDSGFAAALDRARRALRLPGTPLEEIEEACLGGDADRIYDLLVELRAAAATRGEHPGGAPAERPGGDDEQNATVPSLVLPLDQAEELFPADPGTQGARCVKLLAELLGRLNATEIGLIVAATIRTDRYEKMQTDPALRGIGAALFNELKPMPREEFKEVITGPARRTTEAGHPLSIDEQLVQTLISDAQGADTLSLLALTLDRIYHRYARTGTFTLKQYQVMGGIRDVVNSEIAQTLPGDPREREKALALLRSAFIPFLVKINPENNQPMRRVTPESDLPAEARPLIDALVDKRLLVRDRDERQGQVVIEVALESLFDHWVELKGWLQDQREDLKTADDIKHSAAAWQKADRNPDWLLTRTRLEDAEKLAATPQFSTDLAATSEFLAASRQAENDRMAAEEQRHQEELRIAQERQQAAEALAAAETQAREQAQAHAGVLRRRSRILRAVLAGTAIIALVAVIGFVQANRAQRQAIREARDALAAQLDTEASAVFSRGTAAGDDIRALVDTLAAQRLRSDPAASRGTFYTATTALNTTRIIIPTPAFVNNVAFSPDGHTLASGSDDATVRLWNLTDPAHPTPLAQPLRGHTNSVFSVAFSPDGHTLASASADDTVRLWPAPLDATVKTLCSKLTSNISHQQWRDWISPTIGYITLCPNLLVPQN
jgi:truncated hemoglobin YjbI